ncbi:MAG: hypothetical protein ACFCUJ_02275 [Thiotrichales bacterium]
MRLKAKWNVKDKARSIDEIGSAVAFTIWRIGQEVLLHLENDGYETRTRAQRMDVIGEMSAFLIHLGDRLAFDRLDNETRMAFINATARYLANTMDENRRDVEADGDHRGAFIALLNARTDAYAECPFDEASGPGFSMSRTVGDHVTEVMGEKDRKWITQQVMDVEVPEAYKTLRRAQFSLFGWDNSHDAWRPPRGAKLGDE